MSRGYIQAVHDMVIHVEFDDDLPAVHEMLIVDQTKTPLLVDSVYGGNRARCLNIQGDRTIQKRMVVNGTGRTIEIPVGDCPRTLDLRPPCPRGRRVPASTECE